MVSLFRFCVLVPYFLFDLNKYQKSYIIDMIEKTQNLTKNIMDKKDKHLTRIISPIFVFINTSIKQDVFNHIYKDIVCYKYTL